MKREIKAPSVGESITEVRILKWVKGNGEAVKVNDLLLEIESDKATVEVVAEYAGALQVLQPEGATVTIGSVIGAIEEGATGTTSASQPAAGTSTAPSAPAAAAQASSSALEQPLAPSVRKMTSENNLDPRDINGTGLGGRVTKGDVINHLETRTSAAPQNTAPTAKAPASAPAAPRNLDPRDKRQPMTMLRKKIAERLVAAQHTAAILTTFNEVDMSAVNAVRAKHKEAFKAKHGVNLGFMSFFSRAICEAMKDVPMVNGSIDGTDVISRDYVDLGIAVGSPRGLVVPILRDAHKMGFVEIEKAIGEFAAKAKDGKLGVKDLSGGTFTVSNGGTYGSLLSTPILTPPQTAILGMHKIEDRPIALNGQVVIRPMMYVALSYDHRLIDGKEAVTFLVKMKEYLENPEKLGLTY